MNWSNVWLIVQREVRDQLRDRRTLATVVLLPLVLYPLMGMTLMQVTEFMQEHPTQIWILGAESLPAEPPLLEGGRFAEAICPPEEGRLLELTLEPSRPFATPRELAAAATEAIDRSQCAAVVYFPPGFAERLEAFRQRLRQERTAEGAGARSAEPGGALPQPQIFFNAGKDRSRVAHERLTSVLSRWRGMLVEQNLEESRLPRAATEPFHLAVTDVAPVDSRRVAMWSKVLPFVALIWALTGAFYPAIDLCAGEKERGTLETLLCSPALRTEIVWGKLLTVMVFSMATSILNLVSMCGTGLFVVSRLEALGGGAWGQSIGPPPLSAVGWLVLALAPISALFSALALAVASFARSSKEGQYYLMPLLMITLPLIMIPLMPASELTLGVSLIPVTGMMFVARLLIEGEHATAFSYALPVILVTAVCCQLAIRWAVEQFQDESVLFGGRDRWGLALWLRRLMHDREDTPSVSEAILCGLTLLMLRFFAGFFAPASLKFETVAVTTLAVQIALIAAPALLMAIMLTRSPRKTLLLRMPAWQAIPAAVLLAAAMHPLWVSLGAVIKALYPMSDETARHVTSFAQTIVQAPLAWTLLVFALAPAICEELAFRGFVFTGIQSSGRRRAAIVISALFFGAAHGLLQQSLSACFTGLLLGWLAAQTGSLLPCVLYHFTHNSLMLLLARLEMSPGGAGGMDLLLNRTSEGPLYHWPVVALAGIVSGVLLWRLARDAGPLAAPEAFAASRETPSPAAQATLDCTAG